MLYHPPPATHAVYLDHTPTGPPIAVTLARKSKRGGGQRISTLTSADRDVVYSALSDILYDHTGKRVRTVADDPPPGESHAVKVMQALALLYA